MDVFSSPSSPRLSPRGPLSKTGETLRQWSSLLWSLLSRPTIGPPAALHMHHKHFSLITGDYQALYSHCSDLPWVARLHQKAVFYWAISLGYSPYVCIRPMCGEVTNPQKGMGGLGGCAAVNLDVTDGKAVADHYHKSDKR